MVAALLRYVLPLLLLTTCTLTSTPAQSSPDRLYVFDVSDLHLNHYEACIAATGEPSPCELKSPPPGKSYQDLLTDYDTLIFLATLQGIVNRERPQLYLLHDHQRLETPGVDTFWLEKYQEAGQPYGWLADTKIVKLKSLDEVLETFADQVEGVVLWDPAIPATLNVATTIAGVENLAVLRAGSNLQSLISSYLKTKVSLVGIFQPGAATLLDSPTPSSGSPKTDAYLWAKEKYLDTGRANPLFLAYLEDGWPATLYSREQMTRGGVYALERDYVVQQRGFAFDLSPWAGEPPNDDPTQPLGADAATLKTIVEAAEAQAGGELIKVWGFIPWYEKYAAPPGVGSSQHIPIKGEWESTWLFSEHGAYLQGGGGDVFGLAMANVSVHKFGPPLESRAAPNPPTEATLREKGYLTA
ncbi:MAG: GxGYxYP family putative glycoside hydrolase, partial [Anaerolineae bacterium]